MDRLRRTVSAVALVGAPLLLLAYFIGFPAYGEIHGGDVAREVSADPQMTQVADVFAFAGAFLAVPATLAYLWLDVITWLVTAATGAVVAAHLLRGHRYARTSSRAGALGPLQSVQIETPPLVVCNPLGAAIDRKDIAMLRHTAAYRKGPFCRHALSRRANCAQCWPALAP
jgi:hypothetical protein